MAIALVQSATGTSTTATTTATFSTAPTSGNLIVLGFASDDYNGTPDSGWTQSTGMEQQTFHGGYLWWRMSTGTNSFPYTIGSAVRSRWLLMEFSGVHATPYDISNGTLTQASQATQATPSIVPTTGNRLLVAGWGFSLAGGFSTPTATVTNSFSTPVVSGGTEVTAYAMAYRLVTGNGSTGYTSTVTMTTGGTPQSLTGMIISFKEAAGVTYTLPAVAGSYAMTGAAATPKHGWKPPATAGAYAMTGTAATPKQGWKPIAAAGSYAMTGTTALTRYGFKLTAAASSYAMTGTAAAPKYGFKLTAIAASYAMTGTDATIGAPVSRSLIPRNPTAFLPFLVR